MGHMIEKSKLEVVAEIGSFMNKPTLAIHTVKDGKKSERPVISFGIAKAKAILAAMDEIKKFVGEK